MEAVAKKYNNQAEFVFVYCKEAHPEGHPRLQAKTKDGKPIPQAMTIEERKQTAQIFCEEMQLTRQILVDEFGKKSVQALYGGRSNPTFVIGVDGKIALKMGWTDAGLLDTFLQKFVANGGKFNLELAQSVPDRGPAGEGEMWPQMMARSLGLPENQLNVAAKILQAKLEARNKHRQKMKVLEDVFRNPAATEEELAAAVKDFEEAVAQLQKTSAALDRELLRMLSTKAKASLYIMGILENGLGFVGTSGGPRRPQFRDDASK